MDAVSSHLCAVRLFREIQRDRSPYDEKPISVCQCKRHCSHRRAFSEGKLPSRSISATHHPSCERWCSVGNRYSKYMPGWWLTVMPGENPRASFSVG